MRFTDKAIAALNPEAERYEKWEGGGFGIRVTPRGVKSWIWMYRHHGKARRMTLGTYPVVGLADARLKLAKARKLLERGEDPGATLVMERRAEREAETVKELVDEYLEKWARPRKRSAYEDERILYKDVVPRWGRRKAKDIRRRDVITLLDSVVERGAPVQANRTLITIRRVYNWAITRDIVGANPCLGLQKPSAEKQRDRVLSADEVAALWCGLDRAGMSDTTRLALRFQLTTAQRKGEVINAEWTEIDLDEGVWTIPSEKVKNRRTHRVPLSSLALKLLEEIKTNASGSPWLFPSPRGNGPISPPSVDHAVRDNRDVMGVYDVTPHDLRRTAASHMTSMGIIRLTVSKILNHADSGVTAIYDRHSYDPEKRHALEAWGRRLEEITTGSAAKDAGNVVKLAHQGRSDGTSG